MSHSYYTIVNGAAGGGRCRSRVDAVLARLRDVGAELDVVFTEAPGHATELARQAWDAGRRRFLSVGGDGTTFEVLNGLFPREPDDDVPVLGILPLGTGNSFLRDFGITTEEQALAALNRGEPRSCDVVQVEHDGGHVYYMNILGIGFAARVGALTNDRFKGFGTAGYPMAVMMETARLAQWAEPVSLDGGQADERPATLMCFCNSKFTGGSMMMAPEADVADGQVDLIRVGAMGRMRLMTALPRIFKGTHVDMPEVEHRRAHRVEFAQVHPQPTMIDGEILELSLHSLEVMPGALTVLA